MHFPSPRALSTLDCYYIALMHYNLVMHNKQPSTNHMPQDQPGTRLYFKLVLYRTLDHYYNYCPMH